MEYISVKDAAAKWGISERYVQRYCNQGRIRGAVKFGTHWAIPPDAQKPEDLRSEQPESRGEPPKPVFRIPMPLLNTPFAPGEALQAAQAIQDPDSRNIALAEYYYFSGQALQASDQAEPYLNSPDRALQLSACWIYAYANLALDRTERTRKIIGRVMEAVKTMDENTPAELRALVVGVGTAASTLLHLPLPENFPSMYRLYHLLPPGLRLFMLYIQAHGAYLNGKYEASIGIVETALALEGETYPIASIYLHMVATMDYMGLKEPQKAREHLLEAWGQSRPDDLIEPFGEHHGLLGGMLEATLKKDWPEEFRRIIAITYSFSAGWRKIHNSLTGHDVADNLTTTEFSIAMLAARGWSNKEIGAHLGISSNTVKQHISVALQKLGISQRKELARYMLK